MNQETNTGSPGAGKFENQMEIGAVSASAALPNSKAPSFLLRMSMGALACLLNSVRWSMTMNTPLNMNWTGRRWEG